jgi:hypothetical protein
MIRAPLCKWLNFNRIRMPERVGVGTTGAGGRGTETASAWAGQPAATTAFDAAPDGEAGVRVVVVGLGFRAIEDSVEGAGGR